VGTEFGRPWKCNWERQLMLSPLRTEIGSSRKGNLERNGFSTRNFSSRLGLMDHAPCARPGHLIHAELLVISASSCSVFVSPAPGMQ
jgi:hypothetical protein